MQMVMGEKKIEMAIKLSVETSSAAFDFFAGLYCCDVASKMEMGLVNTLCNDLSKRIFWNVLQIRLPKPHCRFCYKMFAALFRLSAKLYRYGADRILKKICASRENIYYTY